jgi:hypothetical protein
VPLSEAPAAGLVKAMVDDWLATIGREIRRATTTAAAKSFNFTFGNRLGAGARRVF